MRIEFKKIRQLKARMDKFCELENNPTKWRRLCKLEGVAINSLQAKKRELEICFEILGIK